LRTKFFEFDANRSPQLYSSSVHWTVKLHVFIPKPILFQMIYAIDKIFLLHFV